MKLIDDLIDELTRPCRSFPQTNRFNKKLVYIGITDKRLLEKEYLYSSARYYEKGTEFWEGILTHYRG